MRYNEIATVVEKKQRKKKSRAYAGGWFYPGYSWTGDASDGGGDGGGGESVVHENLYVDVPNEDWLQDKVEYAQSKKRNSFGVPFMGSTTAYTRNDVRVSVDILKRLPGMRGEQKNVRKDDLFAIMKIMKETNKLPLKDNGEEYAPFINIAYNGEAWVNEGNHRIMAAAALGWEDMPVQISYFDGGERIEDGPMYPGKIGLGGVNEGFLQTSGLVLALAAALAGVPTPAEASMEAVAKAVSIGRQINNYKNYGREGLEAEAREEMYRIAREINKEPGAKSKVLPIVRDMVTQPGQVDVAPAQAQLPRAEPRTKTIPQTVNGYPSRRVKTVPIDYQVNTK